MTFCSTFKVFFPLFLMCFSKDNKGQKAPSIFWFLISFWSIFNLVYGFFFKSSRCLLEPACGHPQTLVRGGREVSLAETL